MVISKNIVWLIMSKDRKFVAKGVPRNRSLVSINEDDNQRFLTYTSESKARSGYKVSGFYGMHNLEGYDYKKRNIGDFLEPVKCEMIIKEVK